MYIDFTTLGRSIKRTFYQMFFNGCTTTIFILVELK